MRLQITHDVYILGGSLFLEFSDYNFVDYVLMSNYGWL
jgi:hypothetical protein